MHSFFTLTAKEFRRAYMILVLATLPIIFTACGTSGMPGTQGSTIGMPAKAAEAVPLTSSTTPPILLFVGTGTSSGDVSAIKTLLGANGLSYSTATSSQLDGMSVAKLESYKLFLVPGGNSITIGDNVTHTATANVHSAIVNGGLHYLGICAGGFFGGYSIYNGLNLTSGVWFNFYADEYEGIHKAAVEIASPSGSKLDQYWQDGPQLSGWGYIVGKYPDGTPAIVEGNSGKGFVILAGIHAEAPASWRTGMTFTTSVAADNAYAVTLIKAALNGTWLTHY